MQKVPCWRGLVFFNFLHHQHCAVWPINCVLYISPWIWLGCPLVPPRLFSDVTVDQSVKERSDLNLYCGASGEPAPNVTWIRVFKNGSESQVLHTGVTWNIERINRTDAGKYRCTANNGVGSPVYHTITVNVSCKYAVHVHCTWHIKTIFYLIK